MNNQENHIIDHLFRHQHGKMVAILTRIFGLQHLETIEDAVQDTFVKAMMTWRNQLPENPEAWLTKAAKNRAVDLLRKIKLNTNKLEKVDSSYSKDYIEELFLEHHIEDSQLRMIFTACHPVLNPKDQIAFALKTIAGFSQNEIAAALLLKPETIKKRLQRARKTIKEKQIAFVLPPQEELVNRLQRVHEVLYLIFNEGWYSNHKEFLIRKELCGEAIRLKQILLRKETLRNGAGYALFALMCFHSARLSSRLDDNLEIISLKKQDRTKWFVPLIHLGNEAMKKSLSFNDYSIYHLEASIALEHLKSPSFDRTNWNEILRLYQQMYYLQKDELIALNIAMIYIIIYQFEQAKEWIEIVEVNSLEQRSYLYYGVKAEYFKNLNDIPQALQCLTEALDRTNNVVEKEFLLKKINRLR